MSAALRLLSAKSRMHCFYLQFWIFITYEVLDYCPLDQHMHYSARDLLNTCSPGDHCCTRSVNSQRILDARPIILAGGLAGSGDKDHRSMPVILHPTCPTLVLTRLCRTKGASSDKLANYLTLHLCDNPIVLQKDPWK